MSTGLIVALILVAPIVVIVLGAIGIMKLQRGSMPLGNAAPSGFQQSPGETREAYVRKHWQRPGVVANGPTLIDLYDRINELERRIVETERLQTPPS